jgi:sortase A
MNLYKYQKTKTSHFDYDDENYYFTIESENSQKTTLNAWTLSKNSYGFLQNLVNTSFWANLIIPVGLISLGLGFIYLQILPKIQEYSHDEGNVLYQGTISPVEDQYIDLANYISNPAGISELTNNALKANILQEDEISKNYRGTFYISIPSLGVNRIPVLANVDSTSESSYNAVLHSSLAHFKNTGLPISNVENNIVIYGHSASTAYNPRIEDPEVTFSFLQNLKVGDDIILEMEGKTYNFKMQRSKIVKPDDVSIITGTKNKRTLTLFTCYPSGSSAYRYVALARPV